MNRAELEKVLEASAADFRLSKEERGELREFVGAAGMSSEEKAFVRNRVFEVARKKAESLFDKQNSDKQDIDALFRWAQSVIKSLEAKSPAQSRAEVFISPGNDCLETVKSLLHSCKERADICVFTITDDRISDAILACAKRGVKVRVISDDDKSLDRGSDVERLEKAGVLVRKDHSEHHMHHKFAIFDSTMALTGSYNWTRSAAKYNRENMLICNDPRVSGALQEEFERLWKEFSPK